MKFFTKKRIVLFLLFIFPLICFLILSTGENNFKKLPVISENIVDISEFDTIKSNILKDHVSVVCFLGNDSNQLKSGLLALNEKIYKKFLDYKQFQIIAIYPKEKETEAFKIKEDLAAFTDMQKWVFVALDENDIKSFYNGFSMNDSLLNLASSKVFLFDKNVNLRGRTNDEDTKDGLLYGYNINSVSELNGKLKDDIKVLYYEYYAAFKDRNKNKADRKEVGL